MSYPQGVRVEYGVLRHPSSTEVPLAFWGRLRFLASRAGCLGEFSRATAFLGAPVGRSVRWTDRNTEERRTFERWAVRLAGLPPPCRPGGPPLWPWGSGWTVERARSYLQGEP